MVKSHRISHLIQVLSFFLLSTILICLLFRPSAPVPLRQWDPPATPFCSYVHHDAAQTAAQRTHYVMLRSAEPGRFGVQGGDYVYHLAHKAMPEDGRAAYLRILSATRESSQGDLPCFRYEVVITTPMRGCKRGDRYTILDDFFLEGEAEIGRKLLCFWFDGRTAPSGQIPPYPEDLFRATDGTVTPHAFSPYAPDSFDRAAFDADLQDAFRVLEDYIAAGGTLRTSSATP